MFNMMISRAVEIGFTDRFFITFFLKLHNLLNVVLAGPLTDLRIVIRVVFIVYCQNLRPMWFGNLFPSERWTH